MKTRSKIFLVIGFLIILCLSFYLMLPKEMISITEIPAKHLKPIFIP